MLVFKQGDLFTSKCKTLVNTVNCVGVMGKGIALQFKQKYPHMFTTYQQACKNNIISKGGDIWQFSMQDYFPMKFSPEPVKILCFATKEHWRNPSKLEWIERGLQYIVNNYQNLNIESIAFPKLGCTNGKLNYDLQVKPLMVKYLSRLPENILIEIYE